MNICKLWLYKSFIILGRCTIDGNIGQGFVASTHSDFFQGQADVGLDSFGAMTFSIMTLSIAKFSLMALSIMTIMVEYCYAECYLCKVSNMLSAANKPTMLSFLMLSVVMLSDVAPQVEL
jgi:hypothetical protein